MDHRKEALALAALLTTTGLTHFIAPKSYDTIVPRSLPGSRRTWVYLSGAAELATAAALALPRTRRLGGAGAAVLLLAVFPANIKMAYDWRMRPLPQRAIAWGRLPLQAPLVWWALRVARGPASGTGTPATRSRSVR